MILQAPTPKAPATPKAPSPDAFTTNTQTVPIDDTEHNQLEQSIDLITIESVNVNVTIESEIPVDNGHVSGAADEIVNVEIKTETISKSEPESISSEENHSTDADKLNGHPSNEMTGTL